MAAPIIGIDLGTTNSVVAYVDDVGNAQTIAGRDGHRIIPSVVWFQESGEFAVGQLAKDQALVEPTRVAQLFKRGMGSKTFLSSGEPFSVDGKVWSPEELSSLVVKKLAAMAEEFFQEPAKRAVITVPAYFGEAERAATKAAGELAGLEVLALPNEPMAAAASHGLTWDAASGTFLVFDLGGGTFDVTILERHPSSELIVKSHMGDRALGGADFDRMIFDRMVQAVREQNGVDLRGDPYDFSEAMAKAEEVKKQLSSSAEVRQLVVASGTRTKFEIGREEFEELLEERLQEVSDTVDNALDAADVSASQIDQVLLVGGIEPHSGLPAPAAPEVHGRADLLQEPRRGRRAGGGPARHPACGRGAQGLVPRAAPAAAGQGVPRDRCHDRRRQRRDGERAGAAGRHPGSHGRAADEDVLHRVRRADRRGSPGQRGRRPQPTPGEEARPGDSAIGGASAQGLPDHHHHGVHGRPTPVGQGVRRPDRRVALRATHPTRRSAQQGAEDASHGLHARHRRQLAVPRRRTDGADGLVDGRGLPAAAHAH